MDNNTQPQEKELTAQQVKAIEALLTSPSIEKAALSVNIDRSTLHRWLKQPEFAAAFRSAKESLVESALTGLQAISAEAVETLHDQLVNPAAKPSEKISAARAVLEYGLKHAEQVEVDKRVAAIEAALEALKEGQR